VQWVIQKIEKVARCVFGYLVRILIFQMGEMQKRGARWIIRTYQKLMSDPRDEKPLDKERLKISENILLTIGGTKTVVHPVDGKARIRCMTFKASDFFLSMQRMGAQLQYVMYQNEVRRVFLNPPAIAHKFFFTPINVTMADGSIQAGLLLPESPANFDPTNIRDRPMILHSHSPGRSMCMERKFALAHLAAGYDITMYDYRGTEESTGTPSEGGYYNDADAVYQHVLTLGYQPHRIYASGFCEGAAVAAYLKQKYHHLGLHFIGSNTYTSMTDVLRGYGWLGKLAAKYGLDAIKDTTLSVPQDGFNTLEKFQNLPHSEGKFILMHTDTDKMMPRGTVQKFIDAVRGRGHHDEILWCPPDPKANGHMIPPYQFPVVWYRYIQDVT
jgi:dienelactone hydrolase